MSIGFIARHRLPIIAAAGLLLGGAGAAAAETPSYEFAGLAITPLQMSVLGLAQVQERAPAATQSMAGMPASPHQIAVITGRGPSQFARQMTKPGDQDQAAPTSVR